MTKQKTLIMEKKPNAHVLTTSVTQTANEILGTKEKTLYFLVIETPNGKLQINVGQKTHDEVQKLTQPRETSTHVQILKDLQEAAKQGAERKP